MIDRDRSVVETELVKLIYFLAGPEGVPADQRRFTFRQQRVGDD